MSAVMNEAAAGFASRDARYGCVLKLVAPTDASEVECGHAVLVAPDLALTVAHCVKQWQRQLQLLCVLSGERAAVASVHWAGGVSHVYGDAARHFPQIPIDKFSDEIVVLRLAAPMRAACAEIELAPRQPAYAVQLAAADRRAGGQVWVAPLQVAAELRGLMLAVDPDNGALPVASGAPVFLQESGDDPLRLIGLQVCRSALPAGMNLPGIDQYAGLVTLTARRLLWILGQRREAVPRASVVAPRLPAAPRHFVMRRTDGSQAGAADLVEIDDLDYFHLKPWRLLASGTLDLLTSEGALWTTRVAGSERVRLQIVTHPVGEVVDLILLPGGSTAAPWPWLRGSLQFHGQLIHVYLYRRSDAPEPERCCCPGRVRVEAYVDGGAHAEDRPERHQRIYAGGATVAGAALPATARALCANDFAQDDVGNGHEGHGRH